MIVPLIEIDGSFVLSGAFRTVMFRVTVFVLPAASSSVTVMACGPSGKSSVSTSSESSIDSGHGTTCVNFAALQRPLPLSMTFEASGVSGFALDVTATLCTPDPTSAATKSSVRVPETSPESSSVPPGRLVNDGLSDSSSVTFEA